MTSEAAIRKYQETVAQLSGEEVRMMLENAKEYNDGLPDTLVMDPFLTGSEEPYKEDSRYNGLLSYNGIMGYIDIPQIDVYLPVGHGTSNATLKKEAGHLYGSSLPVGGKGTHSVISAHRGLPSAKMFRDLDQLEEGEIFYFHVMDQILAYQIDQIKTVEPAELGNLDPETGKDYMTLFTCTPYGINTHRLLVRGVRVSYNPEAEQKQ